MMMIPFEVGDGHFSVFVILEPDNLQRMKDNDPAQLNMWKFPPPFSGLKLQDVILATPSAGDTSKAIGLIREGRPREALKYLSRGFEYKPQEGDNDSPYQRSRTQ